VKVRVSNKFHSLYYSIIISQEKNKSKAAQTFEIQKTTALATNSAIGLDATVIDSLNLPGDDSYYAIRIMDNEPNGIIFITRKDRVVYMLITSGLHTEDHSLLLNLILPKITQLKDLEL
jgi:stress-induced morphogen